MIEAIIVFTIAGATTFFLIYQCTGRGLSHEEQAEKQAKEVKLKLIELSLAVDRSIFDSKTNAQYKKKIDIIYSHIDDYIKRIKSPIKNAILKVKISYTMREIFEIFLESPKIRSKEAGVSLLESIEELSVEIGKLIKLLAKNNPHSYIN